MAAGPTYEPIASTTLTSAVTTITLSSIPATYTDLRVVFVGLEVEATSISKRIRFNGDSGTNYAVQKMFSNGSSMGSSTQSSETGMRFASDAVADSGTIPVFTTFDIMDYAGSNYKSVIIQTSSDQAAGGSGGYVQKTLGLWTSTSAINSISFIFLNSSNWAIGTTVSIYGIAAA